MTNIDDVGLAWLCASHIAANQAARRGAAVGTNAIAATVGDLARAIAPLIQAHRAEHKATT